MTDRPILFSAPMVRALLDGRKTQTRRVIKPQPPEGVVRHCWFDAPLYGFTRDTDVTNDWHVARLLAYKGDRLWVKEKYRIRSWDEDGDIWITYEADGANSRRLTADDDGFFERLCAKVEKAGAETDDTGNYINIPARVLSKPSIFMPRWASRLTLIVTDVRVERLQDISEADAIAEGCIPDNESLNPNHIGPATSIYAHLWDEINGPGAWDANPWVAAYTFTVHRGNIDRI